MKINVAVVGYGNLGKSLEKEIAKDERLNLVGIYSRRNISNPLYRPFNSLSECNDAEIALIALGSYGDIAQNIENFTSFHTVDSYDVHAEMQRYKQALNAARPNKISVIGAGWDPGLLSLCRGTFGSVADNVTTVWGKGISQGHSNALRSVLGVLDAVQFTVPKENCDELILNGEYRSEKLLNRVCYVTCVESDKERIEKEIKAMPHYFENYDTEVIFCSAKEIRDLKMHTEHKGISYAKGCGFNSRCEVSLNCNTDFTAKIMLKYALAVPQLVKDGYSGALDVFDIPLKYIASQSLI